MSVWRDAVLNSHFCLLTILGVVGAIELATNYLFKAGGSIVEAYHDLRLRYQSSRARLPASRGSSAATEPSNSLFIMIDPPARNDLIAEINAELSRLEQVKALLGPNSGEILTRIAEAYPRQERIRTGGRSRVSVSPGARRPKVRK